MPFAEFQPASPALALPQLQLQSQDSAMSLMERATRLQQQKELFPMQKEVLATNIAISSQELQQKQLDFRVASTMHSVEQTNEAADTQLAKLKADRATAAATTASQTLTSQLLEGLPGEVNKLFATISAAAPDGEGFYADYRAKMNAVNAFKARFGGVIAGSGSQGLHDMLGKVQLFEANAQATFQNHVLGSIPDLQGRLANAKTTGDVSALMADPIFSSASAIFPKLEDGAKAKLETLTKDEQEQRQHENTMKRQAQTLENERAMNTTKSTVNDPEFSGVAPTPEAAQKVRDALAVYRTSKDALEGLDSLLDQVDKDPKLQASPKSKGEAKVLQQQLVSAIGRLQIGGVLSEAEAQTMKGIVPDPTSILSFSSANKAKLDTLRRELEVRMKETAAANGISRKSAKAPAAPVANGSQLVGSFNAKLHDS